MKNKNHNRNDDSLDTTLVVRVEGSNEPAKKEWIYTHKNLPEEQKEKLRKEIEELNKKLKKNMMLKQKNDTN